MPVHPPTRCQILPLPHNDFQFLIDGVEKTRWHFGSDTPRPYFYPVQGPSGLSLTRMGHPGAPDHDHHRSLWFAHHDLLGTDFWSEHTSAVIEQSQWYAINDGDEAASVGLQLLWRDGHDPAPLLKQDVIVTIRQASPLDQAPAGEWTLELQSDFIAPAEGVAFRKSNFGILGLRVAKQLSVIFGKGVITGADGRIGEQALFGRPNRWIDYSGIIGYETGDQPVIEGVALIDHHANPGHGSDAWASWHVRDDGWIGPSLSRHSDVELVMGRALRCRYMLYVHAGTCDVQRLQSIADRFDVLPALEIRQGTRAHHQYEIGGAAI